MPLGRDNTKTFHRNLYGSGILETVTLLKRGDDQQQGTVTAYTLFDVRRAQEYKTKEPIEGSNTARDRMTWHIARIELTRNGIAYLNPGDRIVDKNGDTWQGEADQTITVKLCENHVCFETWKTNPTDD